MTLPHPQFSLDLNDDGDTEGRTQSLIGISVAIGGNVLISLALNCQKLAHKRLELQKQEEEANSNLEGSSSLNLPPTDEGTHETQPLVAGAERRDLYTTPRKSRSRPRITIPRDAGSPRRRSALSCSPIMVGHGSDDVQAVAIEVTGEEASRDELRKGSTVVTIEEEEERKMGNNGSETDYLRSKLWWFGFLLMNVGEFGNFLSYAYAPASVVAPLGMVALIANCLFAPLMLKEKLRKSDFLGVVLAIFGAVTIVGAGKQSDIRLDPAGLMRAISQRPFIVYAIICTVLMVVFAILSEGSAGRKWVYVDVGLCALFGGFTVLATKAVSTLLTLHWIEIFKDQITYPVLAVLVITGVGQIKYLNRALRKFASKVVIPIFFVSFNLSAIVGSAILYGDFKDVQIHRLTTFLYGIATTFVGVFFLTRSTEESEAVVEQRAIDAVATAENGENSAMNGTRPVVMPSPRGTPVLRAQKSSASLVLSSGQYLLLAASPPREDRSLAVRNSGGLRADSPAGSVSRRRTLVW